MIQNSPTIGREGGGIILCILSNIGQGFLHEKLNTPSLQSCVLCPLCQLLGKPELMLCSMTHYLHSELKGGDRDSEHSHSTSGSSTT